MGNCWGGSPPAADSAATPPPETGSSQGTSNNFSSAGTTSSSAGDSRCSTAASGSLDGGAFVLPSGEILASPNLRVYSFSELKSVTKKFSKEVELGRGGFGSVYKGWVERNTLAPTKIGTGMPVAIKRLNPDSDQGQKEWQSEVDFLGMLAHENLVKLFGYCWEERELLLVYEFMPNGTLDSHLFKRGSGEQLSWKRRLKIAIGAARGLAFLHTLEKQVIYRDFKASNILLDANYNAKLADFGLAKLGPLGDDSHVSTTAMGTHGYAAPEYISTGHLYVKSDVYGFGVVLLELLTGLRAIDLNRPEEQRDLVKWVKKPLISQRRELKGVMDERIEGQYSFKAASKVAHLALKCLNINQRQRPSMEKVLGALEKIDTRPN